MAIKNKVFFWLLIIFTVVSILDIITATKILPAESNPIYLLTGSILFIVLFKIGLVLMLWYVYYRNVFDSRFFYFFFIMLVLYGIFLTAIGITANVYVGADQERIDAGANASVSEKQSSYWLLITILYIIPMGISLLGFKCYEWSIDNVVIYKKPKKKHWWKFW